MLTSCLAATSISRESWQAGGSTAPADLDGTGTADLVYFDGGGMHVFENRAGNSFGDRQTNECVPTAAALQTFSFVDLHGVGMSTAVWSPRRPGKAKVRYTSPYGTKKPYLLESIDNGMGLEVRCEYQPSTKFYLDDKKAGRPWATKLPFPVQVLSRVESYDRIAKRRFATSYTYHHGFYDTHEREFRGFGLVESLDAESFDASTGNGLFPDDLPIDNDELQQAPVLTKTWFHTGAWNQLPSLEAAFAAERFTGDTEAPPPITCALPTDLPVDEIREAHRALRGTMLRQEVYGTDNLTVPYAVSETSYEVVQRQGRKPALGAMRPKLHAIYQVLARESRSFVYDRVATDPRVSQWLALEYDAAYGFVTSSLSVAYARRETLRLAAESEEETSLDEQGVTYAVATETTIAHVDTVSDAYRLAVPTETAAYEVTGITGDAVRDYDTLLANYTSATSNTLLQYQEPATSGLQRRIVNRIKVRYYDSDHLPSLLGFGTVDARALVFESYQLDLTDDLLTAACDGRFMSGGVLAEGGYVTPSGESGYWIPSGSSALDEEHFYLQQTFTNPFGKTTTLVYDGHDQFVTSVTDALGNVVGAEIDYRVLAPKQITDPNDNIVQAAFDELGRVVKVAVQGKSTGSDGDTLTDPTQQFTYVTDAWTTSEAPNYVHAKSRREHGGTASWQESYTYSDGSGAVAMMKAQAEPDPGAPSTPRWIGSGKTVVNNKGNVVKQYEPFFSATSDYQDEEALAEIGVTSIAFYDPIGRVTRVDMPDGSYTKMEYSVWKTTAYDQHDTLDDSANSWRLYREGLGAVDPNDAKYLALVAARVHENTPTRSFVDAMGRPFLVIAHNKTASTEAFYETRTALDIEGYPKSVTDPLGRPCQTHAFSMAGQLLAEINIDRGERYMVATVLGELLRKADKIDATHDRVFRATYDDLRRVTHLFVKIGDDTEILLERRYFGDHASITLPKVNNLKGKLVALYDQAGLVELGPYDFKGNLRVSARTLAKIYDAAIDWSAIDAETDVAAAKTTVASALEAKTFTESREYDALNRITSFTAPDASEYLPTYNEASLLEKVDVKVRGVTPATSFVGAIHYNEKGQRIAVTWGNGATTEYVYDPQTYRLDRLKTERAASPSQLQDLNYTFDAVGNVVRIVDLAYQTVFFDSASVGPVATYLYDAVYRLIEATGREHMSIGDTQVDETDCPLVNLPHPNQATAVRNYTESYLYDPVGNILEMFHDADGSPHATWTREYTYASGTNRLATTSAPGPSTVNYTHDAFGNMTSMPHLSGGITSNAFDQMVSADNGSQTTYFRYDAAGQRVRKVFADGINLKERIYLGSYEIYRERATSPTPLVKVERHTIHVLDGARRVAMVETLTIDNFDGIDPVDQENLALR